MNFNKLSEMSERASRADKSAVCAIHDSVGKCDFRRYVLTFLSTKGRRYSTTRGKNTPIFAFPNRVINRPLRVTDPLVHRHNLTPTILIKGSEETRMERVTQLLMAQPEQAREQLVR